MCSIYTPAGKNIADYVDPDILERLMALEAEEEAALAAEAGELWWWCRSAAENQFFWAAKCCASPCVNDHLPPLHRPYLIASCFVYISAAAAAGEAEEEESEDEEAAALHKAISDKKAVLLAAHRRSKAKAGNRPVVPRTVTAARRPASEVRAHLTSLGLPAEAAEAVLESCTAGASAAASSTSEGAAAAAGRKRGRSTTRRGRDEEEGSDDGGEEGMDVEDGGDDVRRAGKKARARSQSRAISAAGKGIALSGTEAKERKRSQSRAASSAPAAKQGLKDEVQASKIRKAIKVMQYRQFHGKQGESDRAIPAKKPKHLFTGTAGIGKRDWR